jgi:PAS domain-containing protein
MLRTGAFGVRRWGPVAQSWARPNHLSHAINARNDQVESLLVPRRSHGNVTRHAGAEPPKPGGGHREWVEAWREAVRVSSLIVGLVELPYASFIELSPRASDLLGTTSDEDVGLGYREIVKPRKEVEQTLRLLSAGTLDSMRARRRLRRDDGSVVEVFMCGRAIRSSAGADLGLWIAVDVLDGEERPTLTTELVAELPHRLVSLEPQGVHRVVGTLDHRWRVAQLSTDVDELLGRRPAELVGSSIIDMTHPADAADLLWAFAQATSAVNAGVRVRMRHRDRTWQAVTAVVTVLGDDPSSPFAFVLAAEWEDDASAETRARGD